MNRRSKVAGAMLAGVVLALAGLWARISYISAPQWNLLIITLDTTRADHIGCYGYAGAQTPAIDHLAKRGVLFERAMATAPLTLPSHATMFTGLQPPEHGLVTNGKGRLPEDLLTLAEILSNEGYRTSAFVAAFVLDSKFGLDQGFETYNDDLSGTLRTEDVLHRERPGNTVVDAALDWLRANKNERFHCWIHLYDPHLPYTPHAETFDKQFVDAPYDGEIAFVDRQLDRVLEFLKSEKLDDNTLIVVVGDHGEGLDEHLEHGHGYLLYQSTLQVPLVIAGPQRTRESVRISQPVSLVDLFPTVLELLGLGVPQSQSGRSLAGIWRGEPIPSRDCFSMTDEPLLDNGWAPLRSLTTNDWKYIRTPQVELYNLQSDPRETTNLAPEQPERIAELEDQLAALEAQIHPREADATSLSAAEKRTLASLGYTGGITDQPSPSDADRPDVKAKLPLYNRLAEAVHLLEEGKPAEAEPILRDVVEADPTFRKALGNLGICLSQLGKIDEAIEYYQRVLEIDAADASALVNLAAAYGKQGNAQKAIKHFEAAMVADKESPIAPYRLGTLFEELGDLQQAKTLFETAVERDPTFDAALRSLGDLAASQGEFELALAHYQSALDVNSRSIPTLINLGILAAQQNDLDTAEARFREALKIAPQSPLARENLGRIFLYRGRPRDTIAEYQAILADFPDHFSTILSLGWLRAAHPDDRVRNAPHALKLAEQAVSLSERQSIDALDLLGAAYAEAGRFQDAVAAVDEALEIAADLPGYPTRRLQEHRLLYQNGRPYRSTGM
ncbi:MAG: sulfatase-like hydrolase/transferase [Planctomycetaceae bacterium]